MKNLSQQQNVGMKANLLKYLNPSTLMQPKAQRTKSQLSNIHCRSMQDLDLNLNAVSQSSKENIRSNVHHSSLYNDKQNGNKTENLQNKSRSLSKFIAFFENSNLMGQVKKQVNENKKKNYNGFSYDLKLTGNSTGGNNTKKNMKKKDKENINYQTLTNQRQLHYASQTRSPMVTKTQNNNNVPDEIQKIYRLRKSIQEYKQRESIYSQKIAQFQQRQQQFQDRIKKLQKQKQSKDKKLVQHEERIRQLQAKNKQMIQKYRSKKQSKSSNKQSRQHYMVIKSLKKVINEQLNKIIQLERVKIENEYLKAKLGSVVDDSFSQSCFSKNDDSFQYDTQNERQKEQSLSSTIRSRSDCEFGKEGFKKTKMMKDQINKHIQKQSSQQNSGRHFKSFFQVEQSPISEQECNIMNLFKPYQSRKKNFEGKNQQRRQQQTDMIKICQPQSSFTRQAIQEVNEQENYDYELSQQKKSSSIGSNQFDEQENQQSNFRQGNDSILQEVDQYLTKWRNQQA